VLRFPEKGDKSREIPVRHDLEAFILAYVEVTLHKERSVKLESLRVANFRSIDNIALVPKQALYINEL
jgi:hypothetical protein